MNTLLDTLLNAARNRVRYIRTRNELDRLPLDARLDLDIHDTRAVAKRAIWG
ncbi:hypothetical protein GEU84_001820 [Fertoebacter nigrum]|jgi:hypothetical protein|uniref:DUF1127 domain-containing protein n=1 Tax=Fertoeibacter niger TaxID=2656921 RepID=A0A8X8GWC9_9RHOB|nr:hypothetical protein [Fertoeibacter niger]NUB43108.1 hypothetical protein [Fertoeibacter niger]